MSKWDLTSGYGNGSSNFKTVNQNIKLVQVSGATVSIITRSEAKNYLKLGSDTTDDNFIDDLIKATTKIIENECGGLSICTQTWKQYQKGGIETIELLRQPVQGIPTVSYYEEFEDTTASNVTYSTHFRVVENELHHVDGYFEQGRDGDGYVITFNTGIFDASNYTNSSRQELQVLKTAMYRTMAFLYENREEYAMQINEGEWQISYNSSLPIGIKTLLMPLHTGLGLI